MMTGKDPKDMTASELLRLAVDGYEGSKGTVLANLIDLMGLDGYEWHGRCLRRLADKIDAELIEARADGISEGVDASLRLSAMIWARDNGWPDFRDGEDFGSWLDRCALPRPRWDTGEVVGTDDYEDLLTYSVADDGGWVVTFADGQLEGAAGERVKHPAPEVLGADGKSIVVGETVYSTLVEWLGTPLEVLGIEHQAYVKVAIPGGKGWTSFIADNLTHTPPDTQERIDSDARKDCVWYWGCNSYKCSECPAMIGGETPDRHYGCRPDCVTAMKLDLLRRQRELDKRTGGDA